MTSQLAKLRSDRTWLNLQDDLKLWQLEPADTVSRLIFNGWYQLLKLTTDSYKQSCLSDCKDDIKIHARFMTSLNHKASKSLSCFNSTDAKSSAAVGWP